MKGKTTNEIAKEIKASLEKTYANMEKVYNSFLNDVKAHADSKNAIPNVTAKISDRATTPAKALKAIVDASFEGQKLTNNYYILAAPKINEYYYDTDALMRVLYNAFMNDPNTVMIKTSAEKERQYQSFAIDILQIKDKVYLLYENFTYLGKYTESIVYALNRLQNLIESLDKMKAKEMWVESENDKKVMDIISNDEMSLSDFTDADELTDEDDFIE